MASGHVGPADGRDLDDGAAGDRRRSAAQGRWAQQRGIPIEREREPLQPRTLGFHEPIEYESVEPGARQQQPREHPFDGESNAVVVESNARLV